MNTRYLMKRILLVVLVLALLVGSWYVFLYKKPVPAGPLKAVSHQGEVISWDGRYIDFKYPQQILVDGRLENSFGVKKVELIPGRENALLKTDGTRSFLPMAKIRIGMQAIVYSDKPFEGQALIQATRVEFLQAK